MPGLKQYVLDVLIALDRAANTVLLGSPDETISARLGRWAARQDRGVRRRVAGVICGLLDALDPGHCAEARKAYLERPDRRRMSAFPYRGRVGNGNYSP